MDKVHLKKIQIRLDLRSESSSCASFRCVFASVNFASSLGKGEQTDSIKTFGRALAFQISLYQPLQICIGSTIRIGQVSWCLPYAGFFMWYFTTMSCWHKALQSRSGRIQYKLDGVSPVDNRPSTY